MCSTGSPARCAWLDRHHRTRIVGDLVGVLGTLAGVLVGALLGYRLDARRRKDEAREQAIIDAAAVLSAYRDVYTREAVDQRPSTDPVADRELHAVKLRVEVHCDDALVRLYGNALQAATMFHAATAERAAVPTTAPTDEHADAHRRVLDALEMYSYCVDRFWAHAQQRLS